MFLEGRKKAGEPMPENKTQQELQFQRKHEQDLQRLRGLRLIDDDFMAAVFEDPACAEFLLQIILKREDLKVREVHELCAERWKKCGMKLSGSGILKLQRQCWLLRN